MHAGGTETFERFTERARQAIVLAQEEARLLRHNSIGTEHLLLGLLREEEGLAARVLAELGVTLEAVRADVARLNGVGDEVSPGQIPFTPRAKQSLELALREAISLGHRYIGTEHVLIGVVRVEEGAAATILLEQGAAPEQVRERVVAMLSGERGSHDHRVDTFTSVEALMAAVAEWERAGWEIRAVTVQRRRKRAG